MIDYVGSKNNSVLVKIKRDDNFLMITTYNRKHGKHGRFYVCIPELESWNENLTMRDFYTMDTGNIMSIVDLPTINKVRMTIYWMSNYGNNEFTGFYQTIYIPQTLFYKIAFYRTVDEVEYLYVPDMSGPTINANNARRTMKQIKEDKLIKRAFSKAMRDSFRWHEDHVDLYCYGGYNFYFRSSSIVGGLILHEMTTKNGYTKYHYAIHT